MKLCKYSPVQTGLGLALFLALAVAPLNAGPVVDARIASGPEPGSLTLSGFIGLGLLLIGSIRPRRSNQKQKRSS